MDQVIPNQSLLLLIPTYFTASSLNPLTDIPFPSFHHSLPRTFLLSESLSLTSSSFPKDLPEPTSSGTLACDIEELQIREERRELGRERGIKMERERERFV